MVELLLQLEATKLLIRTTLLTCGSIPINLKGQQITSAYPTYNIPYPYLPALVLNPPTASNTTPISKASPQP